MENQAAVRGKRQKAARHHKTIKDMETTTGSFLSAISTDIESDPAAVRELCQHNFQLDSHLEALEISLEKYTDLINGYEIKGSDDQEFKENQTEWIEQMDEFIRVTNINLVSLKFLQMECQKKDPQPAATAMAAGTTATIMDDDKLDRLLSEMVSMNQSNQSIMTNLTNSQSNASNKTGNTVKLPKLELFTFDGDVMKFKEFQDMFTATVHANKSLSDVEKLSYLKTHVKGKALECISGLALSNSNYKVAWDLLMDRFGKDHVVINARYLALVDLEKPSSRPESLRKFLNDVEANIRSLGALHEDMSQALFIPLITSKLPKSVMSQLELKKGTTTKWTVRSLREAMNHYVDAMEAAEAATTGGNERQRDRPYKPTTHVAHSMAANTVKMERKCIYCGQSHFADECTRYTDAETRKDQLNGRCFICLKSGHSARACERTKPCYYCKRTTHHCSICPEKFGAGKVSSQIQSTMGVAIADCKNTVLQTAVTMVSNESGTQECYARILFDTGATRSFITESLCHKLHCNKIGEDTISVSSFGNEKRKIETMPRVNLRIAQPDKSCTEVCVNVTSIMCHPIQRFPLPNDVKLHDMPLAEPPVQQPEKCVVDILIGLDYYHEFITEGSTTLQNGTHMVKSTFGYLPSGNPSGNMESEEIVSDAVLTTWSTASADTFEFDMEKFWKLEHVGIEEECEINMENPTADNFENTIRFVNGRYFVSWPWKEDATDLPENYELAYGRLKSLLNRVKKTPEVLKQYDDIIQEQMEKGMVERVTETSEQAKPHHYIPHHCIIKPGSNTTKIRIVYDASAKTKSNNKSLNDCLERGPLLLPDLCGMLVRFRMEPIAITSDVEKAFLQVGLNMTDRDVTRFLWVKNIELPPTPDNVEVLRFARVPFGVISSPYLLSATIEHHLAKQGTEVADSILRNTYVDNVLGGVDSVDNAITYYQEAKEMFNSASMNLREWASNSDDFLQALPDEDKTKSENVKVLGMEWNTVTDTINVPSNNADTKSVKTKRQLLSVIASFYDPMGYFSPVVLKAKSLLQRVWKLDISWDDDLPEEITSQWVKIAAEMTEASATEIPRGAMSWTPNSQYELHVFCDASKEGYGTVAYLREIGGSVNVIFSKTRVAPVKELSIPRLELLAVLLGSRVATFLEKELPVKLENTYLWSDSKCVLGWLNNSNGKLPKFVARRVQEIRSHKLKFLYVGSSQNPADLASRGAGVADLNRGAWWNGPSWLAGETEWPASHDPIEATPVTANFVQGEGPDGSPAGIDPERFTSFGKLVRVTAYVQKFIDKIQKKSVGTTISRDEYQRAESKWIQFTQQQHYNDEFEALKKQKSTDLINKLGLFVDEMGLLRCKGRMENAIDSQSKCPILLPGKDQLAELIIMNYHKMLLHSGTNHTLNESRKRFWITRGRETVKTVLKKCLTCKRHEGGPFRMPKLAPLPKERLMESLPFEFTGVDYFGPLNYKSNEGTMKCWNAGWYCSHVLQREQFI